MSVHIASIKQKLRGKEHTFIALLTSLFLSLILSKLSDISYKEIFLMVSALMATSGLVLMMALGIVNIRAAIPSVLLMSTLLFRLALFKIYPDNVIPGMEHFNIDFYVILTFLVGYFVVIQSFFKRDYHNLIRKNPIFGYVLIILLGDILATPYILDKNLHIIWLVFIILILTSSLIFNYLLQEKDDIIWIFLLYSIISLLFIFTTFLLPPVSHTSEGLMRYRGVFRNPNEMGIFAAYSTFLFIYGIFAFKNKLIKFAYVIAVVISIFAIFKTASRNAFLNILIGTWIFFILLLYRKKNIIYFVGGLIFSLFSVALLAFVLLKLNPDFLVRLSSVKRGDLSVAYRFIMIKNVIGYLLKHPIHFIFGHGQVQFYYYTKLSYHYKSPHNIIFDFLFSFGILGLIGIGYLFISTFLHAIQALKKHINSPLSSYMGICVLISSLTTFWISSLFDEVQWHMGSLQAIYFFAPYIIIVLKLLSLPLDSSTSTK